MQYFNEQGESHHEVVQRIREKYGDRAKILTHRNIRVGGFMGLFTREGVEVSGYISNEEVLRKRKELTDEKNRIIAAAATATMARPISSPGAGTGKSSGDTPVSKPEDPTLSQVLSELRELKEKVEPRGEPAAEHESLGRIEELLEQNDFSLGFIKNIMARLRKEASLEELDDFDSLQQRVVEWIGETIAIHPEPKSNRPRRIVLIGPTGVGKTTTIAKLAAMYGLNGQGEEALKVRMITIDNYRIGARGQLETYGDIMNIPVASVEDRSDMEKKLALFADARMILIDTTGRNPRDYQNIASMRELLDACGSSSEYYLALSATTKASDIREICQEFEPFKYQAIILTKLDETLRVGNIISILAEQRKPLAFITDGQGVPLDIHRATRGRLLRNLEGFKINRQRLDEIYPERED